MLTTSRLFYTGLLCLFVNFCKAQIEVDYITAKDFKAVGFGGFINFALPVSDANYATAELGLQYFNDDYAVVALAPILLGYRYTLNQSGAGLYAEPNAGYCFAYSDNNNISGIAGSINLGYLFSLARIQFNVAFRYQHVFNNIQANVFGFRISHAFTFGRRNDY